MSQNGKTHSKNLAANGLTFPILIPGEDKINLGFLFSNFLVVIQKVFMKTLKAFIKPYEAPQRSLKIKK